MRCTQVHSFGPALTTCFIAALLMCVLTVLGLPNKLFQLIPQSVKHSMPVGLGLLMTLVGFQDCGIVVPSCSGLSFHAMA